LKSIIQQQQQEQQASLQTSDFTLKIHHQTISIQPTFNLQNAIPNRCPYTGVHRHRRLGCPRRGE
jgi:hypothetical protein